MPDLAAATPSPGSPASPGQSAPQSPPIGVSPVTQSTPNRGYEMAGLQRLGVALKMIQAAVPMLDATSEAGRDALKIIGMLAKHIKPGDTTAAGEKNSLQDAMMRQQQQAAQQQAMRQKMMQSQGGQQAAPQAMQAQKPPMAA